MTFKEIEWEREFHTASRTIVYKRYEDKMYWLRDKDWIEIEPNYKYNGYEYI